MDSLEVESERKHEINASFLKMKEKGKNYKIWFENANPLERQPD